MAHPHPHTLAAELDTARRRLLMLRCTVADLSVAITDSGTLWDAIPERLPSRLLDLHEITNTIGAALDQIADDLVPGDGWDDEAGDDWDDVVEFGRGTL